MWNHGDYNPQINTTFLGLVGPGVQDKGVDNATWSSHADIQPTMMSLLGLHDDYTPDGRVLTEVLNRQAPAYITQLGEAYSQLDSRSGHSPRARCRRPPRRSPAIPWRQLLHVDREQVGRARQARDALVKQIQQILDSYSSVEQRTAAYAVNAQSAVAGSNGVGRGEQPDRPGGTAGEGQGVTVIHRSRVKKPIAIDVHQSA